MYTQPVSCRYCGLAMQHSIPTLIHAYANGIMPEKQYAAYYKCDKCGSITPFGYGRTKEYALESAYNEAMRTPNLQTHNKKEHNYTKPQEETEE